ncbi:MAG TPA: tyrosine--tRNA ligase [Candidatus Woesearchaeota archaeon]|nr:tyrosine--tRNA ligase [Candidatus Woesearchaeota archaeon]
MSPEEKKQLIVRDLQEVVGEEELLEILKKRSLKVYWGAATTGKPHVGYFVPMFKIADLLNAGSEVTILFANLHAYLDNMKTNWELLEKRTEFYQLVIKEMLKRVNVPLEKLKFIKGTDFQLQEKYTLDMYKIAALSTVKDTQKAGAEVVKQMENPKMSSLVYPILQALDEVYLGADAQFGGVDQRKIFMFAREFLPKVGHNKSIHLMNPMVPGLGQGGKMSSSDPNSKIDFEDSDKEIGRKINKAYSEDGVVEDNGLLAMAKFVIFKFLEEEKRNFQISRPEKYGGNVSYKSYEELEQDFRDRKLSSIDLKSGMSEELIKLIAPIRELLLNHKKLIQESYPEK